MTQVRLWGALRPAAQGLSIVELPATTIRELFQLLEERYPKMQPFIEQGVAVSINGVVYQDDWSTTIPKDAEVYLLPRIEGG